MTTISQEPSRKVSLWYDPKVRSIVSQAILILLLAWGFYEIVTNTIHNLHVRKISSGFGFLNTTAGFNIVQSLIEYNESSTYGRAFVVGLLNTVFIAVVGIILATIWGFLLGVARLSKNWVINKLSTLTIEILRNIPLLLQIIVWYTILLHSAPGKRSYANLGFGYFNVQGIWVPKLVPEPGMWMTWIALVAGIALAWMVARWAKARQDATGQQFPSFWVGLAIVIALPALVFLLSGSPATIEHPQFVSEGPMLRRGFTQGSGLVFIPEFLALLFALVLYTSTFIAEIVRAGILAVSHGQTEAAAALGLRHGKILQLVVIPQAMRIIIPPLTSQYLNLTKNSSLAVAIAYPDVVHLGGIILNQSGQAVEMIVMIMGFYLATSILTSLFMNWFNAKMSLVER